jgi:hypothetical protein
VLALVVSTLIAVYLFGPDLISRWILGWVVPRKNLVLSRAEEVTRAVLWAAIPLAIAVVWAVMSGSLARCGSVSDIETVFSGLYSQDFFEAHRSEFFKALRVFLCVNLSLLLRLYTIVVGFSLLLNFVLRRYSAVNRALPARWMKTVLATVVLPRASEWHVLLSDMLLPSSGFSLRADVLTKSGVLYQGRVQEKMLNPDGTLQSITLGSPRRFLRNRFQRAKAKNPSASIEDFWLYIPGNLFIIMGSEITNLNLRYVREDVLAGPSPEELEVLRRLLRRLEDKTGQKP